MINVGRFMVGHGASVNTKKQFGSDRGQLEAEIIVQTPSPALAKARPPVHNSKSLVCFYSAGVWPIFTHERKNDMKQGRSGQFGKSKSGKGRKSHPADAKPYQSSGRFSSPEHRTRPERPEFGLKSAGMAD